MKRFSVLLALLPVSFLALSSCRSPVLGGSGASLSLSLSIPADLSSSIPEPVRRAIGEAELSGSNSRVIHPDARLVKAIVTQAGAEVSSVEASLALGVTSKELTINGLPTGVALTLNVALYDDSNTKVGERTMELGPLSSYQAGGPKTVGILPIGATPLEIAESQSLGVFAEGQTRIFSLPLTGRGLYQAQLLLDGVRPTQALAILYAPDGSRHKGFAADPGNILPDHNLPYLRYGIFSNDSFGESTFYLVVTGPSPAVDLTTLHLTKLPSDLAVFGELHFANQTGPDLLSNEDTVDFSSMFSSIGSSNLLSISLYNSSQYSLSFKATILSSEGECPFSPPTFPSQDLPPGGVKDFLVSFSPTKLGDYNADFTIDFVDDGLTDFTIPFYGSGSE